MNQREIARLAGVSVATVSRVINNCDNVTEKTKEHVRKILRENSYVQNINAKNLRTARSNAIGFLISYFGNPFFNELFKGLESVCNENGFIIIVGNSNEDEGQERKAIDQFLSYRVRGIVASFVHPSQETIVKLSSYDTELVMLDRFVEAFKADSVGIDNLNGSKEQVRHLAQMGHRRIAVIHGTLGDSNGIQRMDGFRREMAAYEIPIRPEYVKNGLFMEDASYAATIELMNLSEPPTAIVAHNNLMTIGAFRALKDMRLRIPQDVSLVGFDPFALSDHLEPRITLIDRPLSIMGELAAKLIIERINGVYTGAPRNIIFPVKLRIGDSCAPPKNT